MRAAAVGALLAASAAAGSSCTGAVPVLPAGTGKQGFSDYQTAINEWQHNAMECAHKEFASAKQKANDGYTRTIAQLNAQEAEEQKPVYARKTQAEYEAEYAKKASLEEVKQNAEAALEPQYERARKWRTDAKNVALEQRANDKEKAEKLACERWQAAVQKYNPGHEPEWDDLAVLNCGAAEPPPVADTPAPYLGLVPPTKRKKSG